MSYKITITKIESKVVKRKGNWTTVDQRPWTDEELSHEFSQHYGNKQGFLEKNPLKEIRGYAPPVDGIETEETKILEQTVNELDLAAVIKAVNDL
jgi:hypothetical protein